MEKQYICQITGSIIPPERVEALQQMDVPEDEYTIVQVSPIQRKREAPSIGVSKNNDLDAEIVEVLQNVLVG